MILGNRLPLEQRVQRGANVLAGGRESVRTRIIELAPVDKLPVLVEYKGIRRGDGRVGFRDGLRLIIKKRKYKTFLFGHFGKTRGRIVRIGIRVVGADRHDRDSLVFVITPQLRESAFHVLDIRTMAANKHDYQGFLSGKIFERDILTGRDIGQTEIWRGRAERQEVSPAIRGGGAKTTG